MLGDDNHDHTLFFLVYFLIESEIKHSRQIVGVLHFMQAPASLQAAA